MNATKFETNYKRNLYFNETKNIKTKKYSESIEFQVINIYPNLTFQSFQGFGGAFTGASCLNLNNISEVKRDSILEDYFSENGLGYSFCRIPIGSSDFSDNSYSYSNKKDLSDFSIDKDLDYIIPTIKLAKKYNPDIKFLASPWSPPAMFKSNKLLCLGGRLLDKYKQAWADYLVKFVKAYEKEDIIIDYITVQNEPNAIQRWESCQYSPEEEIDFVTNYLYPTFVNNDIKTKILIWDQNKEKLLKRSTSELLYNSSCVSGIAFHWYTGDHFENISLTHSAFPDKLLIHTEGCTGFSNFNPNDEVHNAEIYAHDILGDLNSGVNGYIDWNLVLDHNGGPNHKKNFCNSPIMLDENNSDFIKNLTYFYIGHFSKFIKNGAKRIGFSRFSSDIEVTAFENKDSSIVVVLLNKNNFNKEYNLVIKDIVIHDNLDSHAIVSYVFK